MQMLPDSPSDYYREAECTKFLTAIPTEWDETVPMDCQIGDYVTVARRNGDDWYLASVTDWTPRTIDVDLSFLEKGRHYRVELFKDGVNADIKAIDYKHEYIEVEGGQTISLQLASGGGWVARITKAAMISSEQ
jgi:alpha-glucosidase